MKKAERKTTGLAAAVKLLETRMDDVIRVYVTEATLPRFRPFLRDLAQARKAYHVVSEEDMRKVCDGAMHHEGVCVLARTSASPTVTELVAALSKDEPAVFLYLENVANPHNVGAIVRVAVHFGACAVCVDAAGETLAAVTSGAMARTAEGGAEVIPIVPLESIADSLAAFAAFRNAGFSFVATSSHASRSLFGPALPARTVLLLGSESDGLSPELTKRASITLGIPGTGAVESLNVACAASALLTEYFRQHFWSRKPVS